MFGAFGGMEKILDKHVIKALTEKFGIPKIDKTGAVMLDDTLKPIYEFKNAATTFAVGGVVLTA